MRNLDDFLNSTLSGVPLDSFPYLRKIVKPCHARQTQKAQSSTTFNVDGYTLKFYEPASINSVSLKMTLTTEALSSDAIVTPGLETTLKEHVITDTHDFNFILKEAISEPPLFILTNYNEDYGENFSLYHRVGFLESDISDLKINPVGKANTDKKGKSEDAHFSAFTQCIGLAEEEDNEYYYYHYHLQQGSSGQVFSLEALALPSLFKELALGPDHTSGTEKVAYEHKGYGKRGNTSYLPRNNGLVSHYARALQHMEPMWMPALGEQEGQQMARLSDSSTLSLERQNKAALWTIETMLCD
ncbi:unnamed protein product [Phytomonas sp. EM1]|nr:unnamed protein product [Phytomonas sp. EM1]|eukprot:CCW64153.1 unnamed protein product [Phytomonas sp. isolate EM1]